MNNSSRPDPERILEVLDLESRLRDRGRLKIFFGASPGVGKTYAMLQTAKADQADGVDVLIGVIETHGRIETQNLLDGFSILPRKSILYGNVKVEEFDIDAALARRPKLILVDELAHTNAAGCRHPKRWQDVEELLNAGIDVYTTVNVQHLEGLNDAVTNITGISVREMVPEQLFDEANEIQLIDIPTEELLDRLREGKVYITSGVKERAAQNFFNRTNLMSLRELALRRTAEHVDADTDYQRVQEGLFTPNIAGDRILVCVGQDELATKLVRTARKIAGSLKAPWYALAIEGADSDKTDANYQHQQRALLAAERNGAFRSQMIQEEKIGDAILNYATNNGITKIVVGRNIRPVWFDWIFGSLVEYLIRNSGIIDVYVITGHSKKNKKKREFGKFRWIDCVWAILALATLTGFGVALRDVFKPIDIIMIYLIGVIMCAVKFGRIPSFIFAVLSVATLNYFFIEPIYTFTMVDGSYWLSLLVMLATSFVITQQATGLRRQTHSARQRENQTQIFYLLTRSLAGARSSEVAIDLTLEHIQEVLNMPLNFLTVNPNGSITYLKDFQGDDKLKEESVAVWAYQNGEAAGIGTNTMPSANGFYFPVIGHQGYGVIAVYAKENALLTVDLRAMIETFAKLLTTALDRVSASMNAEQLKIDREAERLKNTFLSSMSHDMRTPLAAIRGSAETLLNTIDVLDKEKQKGLIKSIADESERLFRLVKNLLDLTRFETGNAILNQQPYFLPEIIGSSLKSLETVLSHQNVILDIPKQLPMVNIDANLVEQVFQNLIENAVSFRKVSNEITISAREIEGFIEVNISDRGPGLPEGHEKTIFDKFFTLSQEDRPKGAGLGLAICQAIIVTHGGEISAQNRTEGGASFTFTLPLYKEGRA